MDSHTKDHAAGEAFLLAPYWLPVTIVAAFACSPWLPWSTRFTFRTVLIAMTLIAVVLGLMVWAIR